MSVFRTQHRQRIDNLLKTRFDDIGDTAISFTEAQAHWSKYLCVLVSGYLEQNLKNLLLEYCGNHSRGHVTKGVENLWPKSRNMTCASICDLLEYFNKDWKASIEKWFATDEKRKADLNNLISWRNNIAHGNDANTTGVTVASVKQKFLTVNLLLDEIEQVVAQN